MRAKVAEQREYLNALMEKVCQGDNEDLYLLRAYYFQGHSHKELARWFGLTVKAVDGRIRRLEKKMCALAQGSHNDNKGTAGSGSATR
jgi:DNA-directed RNA polymerase specialized sigma24 family protein